MSTDAPREMWTRECCYITELVNDPDWPELSLARARVEPGVTTELHAVSVLEIYVIEHGRGMMRVGDGTPYEVRSGDTVTIPAGEAQSITNVGDDDLVFFCVCAPRFRSDRYTALV